MPDFSRYTPACGVNVRARGDRLDVSWPMGSGEWGRATFNFAPGGSLLELLGIASDATGAAVPLLQNVAPVTFLTVGTREAPSGRPPTMPVWNVFFDKPAKRPFQTYASRLQPKQARVTSEGRRASVSVGDLTIGPFTGELQFTFYATSRLVHVEAVVQTQEDRRAILYDAGLSGVSAGWRRVAWMDPEGRWQRTSAEGQTTDQPMAVRHRAIVAETANGSVACFPPPHQFQFSRDWTDNLKFAWVGRGSPGPPAGFGFGVRQVADGKRAFEPWFNAPPGTRQRLGVFYLLTRGQAEEALRETLRYTHGDRFPELPGHVTFTTHYHMAVAVDAMARQFQGVPEFVPAFKEMGVNMVHIADFHGDGHPKDPGPLRLPELEAMNKECRRLSGPEFLLIPGEEINEFLGLAEPGKHPGHWMSLFPKPVYWTQTRTTDVSFAESHPTYGTLYHVGSGADMMELLRREHGLAWSAHPRIKASSWTPDIFRQEDFYLADFWLGAAWKAMPADLSRERLGERGLDLLDDMANWGQRKYMPGEVDVFKIDHTHELYGHMNINYVRLERVPRFEDGWQPVLDALRRGRFFVTTGEVLLREATLGGKAGGETLPLQKGQRPEWRVALDWTFPLRFAEVISGDGRQVYRERIDLADTTPFGERLLTFKPRLEGRKWARLEVWDVAANGAFTQPVWLEQAP
ncbi:MAG TPA: hypothetical protein VNH84_09675 [Candidatus Saccharimonadales bacterium]|nr:hypothetical protein [Candidatus Saccharimonadales bacterium]